MSMKIAREIAKEIEKGEAILYNATGGQYETMSSGEMESIIAEKLKPLRAALDGLVGTYKDEPPKYNGFVDMLTTGDDIRRGVEALALFEEGS